MAERPSAVRCVAVAYSGGRDSTALAHAAARVAAREGWRVVALHVHHGLSAAADAWVRHGAEQVAAWQAEGLPIDWCWRRLAGRPPRGDSVEAWARAGRYAALATMAREAGAGVVLLAHHRRDQAETLLLQALRGAGPAGLAAMPRCAERDGLVWLRPWLHRPRAALEAYLQRHGLRWVDDEAGNADARFARNRLRHQVWPALEAAFPQAEASLADAAARVAQARAALDDLAREDLGCCQVPGGGLRLSAWAPLAPARRVAALRQWFRQAAGRPAPASLLQRLARELLDDAGRPGPGGREWPAPGGRCRQARDLLHWEAMAPAASGPAPARARRASAASASAASGRCETLGIRRAGRYRPAGWSGTLLVRRVSGGGVPLARLAALALRARAGGETFQAGPGRPPRALKKQYQAAGVAAAARHGPLLWAGADLLFVPGLGLDARALAAPGEPQVALDWLPDEAAG
ncbi:tRNA lysidine(34) synthetase TilS [Piscinibacter sakaiensis]|uniref:tRNA(Ile)-lysidine synthase n=1 Tax=Piscinibacter sakaiensis TaxID=1547922 RepID=A0A0K8NZ52_PISS1|nr:tRNA lysidine(34) synthetase TilS [Piscinibacter sakaiensis]GAP35672.1 tRNA(Ile)-lysidine synthetase [Piscinibacter sakaiensis]